MNLQLNVHYSFKPVYYISRFAFTWPFKYVNRQMIPLSYMEKLPGIIVGILHVALLSWSLYERNILPRVKVELSQSLLDDISTVSATLLTLVAIARNNLTKNITNSTKFFKQITSIDRVLQFPNESYKKNHRYLRNKSLIRLVLVVLLTCIDNYMWISSTGLLISTYYFHSYSMYILNDIVTLQIDAKIILLKERFALLNEKLSALVKEAAAETTGHKNVKPTDIKPTEETIRSFNKIFDVLCDLIESVNKCHGVEIIILALTILTVALNTLVIGFTLFRSVTHIENVVSTSMQFLWSAYYIVSVPSYEIKLNKTNQTLFLDVRNDAN